MNSLARTALRLSLTGAGIAALGAGLVGQASAAELPELPAAPDTSALTDTADSVPFGELQIPDTEALGLPELPSTDSLPSAPSLPGTDGLPTASPQAADVASELPSAEDAPELPSTDDLPELPSVDDAGLPSVDDAGALPVFEVPAVMHIEAPTGS